MQHTMDKNDVNQRGYKLGKNQLDAMFTLFVYFAYFPLLLQTHFDLKVSSADFPHILTLIIPS